MSEFFVRIPLKMLALGGLHPTKSNSFLDKVKVCWALSITMMLTSLVFAGFYFEKNDIGKIVKLIEGVCIYSQLLMKMYSLLYYKNDFAVLLNGMKNFWEVNNQQISFKQLAYLYKMLLSYFMVGVFVSVIFYISKPFFPSHTLATELWIPDVYLLTFNTIWVYQICLIFYIVVSIVAFDILFAAIAIAILLQFKLLNKTFAELEFEKSPFNKKKFAECVKHQVYLSNFVVALKGIYSNFFVFQVLSSVVLYTAELTPIILDSSDISDVFKNVCISTACIGQFCLYCIPAAEITAEAERISESVFYNNWYDSKDNVNMYVRFVIMNARRKVAFSAGGVADISRETITFIFKSSMSLIAMFRSLKGKQS